MPQRCYNNVRLLDQGPSLKNIEKVDSGAMPMILSMASRGIQVDLDHFEKIGVRLVDSMEQQTEEVRSLTGYYVNLGSGDQVADLLFKKLGLKQARVKMTTSGDRESVADEILKAIQHEHPVIPIIQDYKEYEKLHGTYVVPMPKLARHVGLNEWRMFPNFNTTRVPSGRLSCKDPNLLAMPNRTEMGREVCMGFITKPGWCYLSVDESQIEMRIGADRSRDENLMNIYFHQEDIYSDFATSAFRLDDKRYKDERGKWQYPTVDKKLHRFPAKTCILASMYRVTGKGLLEQMPVICSTCNTSPKEHTCQHFTPLWTEPKCDALIAAFYMRYPGLMRMQKRDDQTMLRHAMIWDMWGRLLHVQAVRSVHEYVRAGALREGGNFPIQSGAQGTVKLTMARVYDDWEMMGLQSQVHALLQVHDELLFECENSIADDWGEHVAGRFCSCVQLPSGVPIKAGIAKADNWGSLPK